MIILKNLSTWASEICCNMQNRMHYCGIWDLLWHSRKQQESKSRKFTRLQLNLFNKIHRQPFEYLPIGVLILQHLEENWWLWNICRILLSFSTGKKSIALLLHYTCKIPPTILVNGQCEIQIVWIECSLVVHPSYRSTCFICHAQENVWNAGIGKRIFSGWSIYFWYYIVESLIGCSLYFKGVSGCIISKGYKQDI